MTDFRRESSRYLLRPAVVSLIAALVVAAITAAWFYLGRPEARAWRMLERARAMRTLGKLDSAENLAAGALKLDSSLSEAALLAARCARLQREYERAVSYARRVTDAEPAIRLESHLLSADLNHHHLLRLSDAEHDYRKALEIDSDHVEANAGLAHLLGLCARRQEAIPHVLRLIRQGEVTDLMIMLGGESVVIQESGVLERAHERAPHDPNPLIGLAWHAAEAEQVDEAVRLLQSAIHADPPPSGHGSSAGDLQPARIAAYVALGDQLAAASRFDELKTWVRQVPSEADRFPRTWVARAKLAEVYQDTPGAIRCYLQASRLAPELQLPNVQLARLLDLAGDRELSERFAERVRLIEELKTAQDKFTPDVGYLLELADRYAAAGRFWEAYGWCRFAHQMAPTDERVSARMEELRRRTDGAALKLTDDSANVAASVNLTRYPLPQLARTSGHGSLPSPSEFAPLGTFSFREEAAAVGISFRYFNGTPGSPSRRMFEFTGGGIGVLDFDSDGYPDVCFTQGCVWPPGTDSAFTDALFRNRGGKRFDDVTGASGVRDTEFGQGVSVGDINLDGFPDLYVANIGANRLLINNGDGTFTDAADKVGLNGRKWTTSCVMADLNGDAAPDLYDVNYVKGPDVFERVCTYSETGESPRLCLPFEFDGETDCLWLSDGNGAFTDATSDALSVTPDGKGLGAAVWDADGSGRLSLFVANDTTPNFFFVPDPRGRSQRLLERGILAGTGLNAEGKSEGCMGVALGDVDDDGDLEIHVTNFFNESNTLYAPIARGAYEDRTRSLGLRDPTLSLLGFGTQFFDMDLDGHLELFVTNGHVDDLRSLGRDYQMRPQLFRWNGRGFDELDISDASPYFARKWLGRAVARLDWNRDGRDDLIVGHLREDSALLTNTTADSGNVLSMKLIGVQSGRDAIGTTVHARIGARRLTRQLTAGDGYQASNERRLIIGCGHADQIDTLTVRWPSGAVQEFRNVGVPQNVILIENRPDLLPTDHGK